MAVTAAPPTAMELLGTMIDDALDNGDIIPSEEALRITEAMATEHPEAWREFVDAEAHRLVMSALHAAIKSRRQRARQHRDASGFERASGEGFEVFRAWRCRVDADNTQRAIGEMTGADHTFVAGDYERSANEAKMLGSFHKALARKCGKRTTSEVMTEAEFEALYRSITGS